MLGGNDHAGGILIQFPGKNFRELSPFRSVAAIRREAATHIEHHDTPERFAELARTEPRGKVARRLMAVRLAMLGRTAAQVAAEVLLSDRQVRTWVARHNAEGATGLADRTGRGNWGRLTPEQEERLVGRLRAGPTPPTGSAPSPARTSAASRPKSSASSGLSSRSTTCCTGWDPSPCVPVPRHPGADVTAQAAFKKASRSGSPPSPPRTLRNESRSGSRTRPGSARRAY